MMIIEECASSGNRKVGRRIDWVVIQDAQPGFFKP
jgi:hypothetical protein